MTTERKQPPPGWKKGQSGNPKGRPPGVGPVNLLRAAIADRVPEILAKLIAQALEGDTGAARLLLERAIAPLKSIEQAQVIKLPASNLTDQGQAVLSAIADGALAPGQGGQLIAAIVALARMAEISELENRIAAIESKS